MINIYKYFNEEKHVYTFLYLLNLVHPEIKNVFKLIDKYNEKAKNVVLNPSIY